MATAEITQIRLQHLHVPDFHHRSNWSHLPELRDSILANGIICPLVVRKRKAGGYEIGAGVCRSKAAGMAELKTVPCIVVDLDDEDFIALQVDENRQRADLHPIDEALYCDEFAKRGMQQDAIAKRLGLKKRDVIRRMKLLALGPKTRKAFVEGRFDEEAALALATTGDAAKQADVLAALETGALQCDEIVSYIRRTFTATLDDVPWRMSDETVVVKAGACTTCPKRSDAQRDLFSKEQTGLRCLDVDCHRSKMEATWQKEAARPDASVFDQPADAVFLQTSEGRPTVLRSSGMVDADGTCSIALGKTWREAVFSHIPDGSDVPAPTIYLARDQDGRPRWLMREATAARIVKRGAPAIDVGNDNPPDHIDGPTADAGAPAAAPPSQRAENKVRRLLVRKLAEKIMAADSDSWAWVTERIVGIATPRATASAEDLLGDSIRALDGGPHEGTAGLILLAKSSNRQAKRVATAVLLFEEADAIGPIPQTVLDLAASCEVDVVATEAEVRGSK